MVEKIVEFPEIPFCYVASGNIEVQIPRAGDYNGVSIRGDPDFCVPNYCISPGHIIGFSISENSGERLLYMHWKNQKKTKKLRKSIGKISDLEAALEWLKKVDERYNKKS